MVGIPRIYRSPRLTNGNYSRLSFRYSYLIMPNRYYLVYVAIAFVVGSCNPQSNDKSVLSGENPSGMEDTTGFKKVTSKDGTTIGFWKSGSGPPLLLVHGTTADHNRWSGILPKLEQHFTVYAMDRRGRGASADAPSYNVMREAEDVVAVLEDIGEPAFVLAHSYGAVCALESALLADKVRRLILYEPPIPTGLPMYPPHLPDRMMAMIDSSKYEKALELFMREVVRMPEDELKAYRERPAWKGRIKLAPTIPRELAIDRSYQFDPSRFTHFQVPTLLLLGGDSPDLFRSATAMLDSALTTATVVTLPGQQHIAMDTNPELFLGEVMKFLQQ